MKTMLGITLLFAINAVADDLIVSFSTTDGRLFKNVKIISSAPDGIVWVSTNTPAGGKVKFSDMDSATANRLGYDRDALLKHEKAEERRRVQDALVLRRSYEAAERKKRIAALEKYKVGIYGEVLQKLQGGLLVLSGTRARLKNPRSVLGARTTKYTLNGVTVYNELCFLEGYTNYNKAVDGDLVMTFAYPNGQFSYTAVSGGSKSVRRFTCDPEAVERLPTKGEMDAIFSGHRYD